MKSWGHMGGTGGSIVIKTDGESSIVALREALAKYNGGIATPETPPHGGESSPRLSRRQRAADAQFDQSVFEPVGREGEH